MHTRAITAALALAVAVSGVLLPRDAAAARGDLPVLRAKSRTVDIQDGDKLLKGIWRIEPDAELDVYLARRSSGPKRVTFITDVDSLSFDVEPRRTYAFVVLLDEKIACPTQISTMRSGCERAEPGDATGPVELPITLRAGKLCCRGRINGSEELDLIFDTAASTNVVYPSATDKGVELRLDGTVDNAGFGGTTTRQVSSDNRLEVGGLRWEHEEVLYIEKQSDAADGVLGFPAFENKVVEIDYDRMVMTIHDALPARAADFTKIGMHPLNSLSYLEATLVSDEKRVTGLFLLDTGGNGALLVDGDFAAAHGLPGAMRRLGTSVSRGVGSGEIENAVVLLPRLTIAGFDLRDVSIHVSLSSEGEDPAHGGVLCMDVLRRFNTILDYPREQAYLQANAHFDAPF